MKNKFISLMLLGGLVFTPVSAYAAEPGEMITSYCESPVMLRAEPSTDSQILGQFNSMDTATVVGAQDGWYQVTSGGMTGWVSCDYFLEGDEAITAADSVAYQIAVPNGDAINIREAQDENSNIIGVGNSDNQLRVTNYDGGAWVSIVTSDGMNGYVNAGYVTIQNIYPQASGYVQSVVKTEENYTEPETEESYTETAPEIEENYTESESTPEEGNTETASDESFYGTFTLTAYCGCDICNGGNAGVTASGAAPVEGWTVACNSLPLGTQVSINGNVYEVQDTGNMDDDVIDIYMDSHEDALAFGVQSAEVYIVGYSDTTYSSDAYEDSDSDSEPEVEETSYEESEVEYNEEDAVTAYSEDETQVDIGDGYVYDTETDTVTDTNTGEVYSGDSDIVAYARQFVGVTPYSWGGNSYETGMDCSHFVWNVLKDTGAYDGDYVTSDGFLNLGEAVDGLENAQAGDVIVYNGHVAIYDGEGGIIEAKGAAYGTTNDRAADSSEILGIRRFN